MLISTLSYLRLLFLFGVNKKKTYKTPLIFKEQAQGPNSN